MMKASAMKGAYPGTHDSDMTSAATGAYRSVAGYKHVLGVAGSSAMASGKILTVTLMQATDASGTSAKSLATNTATAPASGGVAALVAATVEEMDVANGFTFVAVRVSADEAVAGNSQLILEGARYS